MDCCSYSWSFHIIFNRTAETSSKWMAWTNSIWNLGPWLRQTQPKKWGCPACVLQKSAIQNLNSGKVTAFTGIDSPASFSREDFNGWNEPVWPTKSYTPCSNCLKSQARILQISCLVSSVMCGVPITVIACFVFHASPRTHPVLQLHIVAVLPLLFFFKPWDLRLKTHKKRVLINFDWLKTRKKNHATLFPDAWKMRHCIFMDDNGNVRWRKLTTSRRMPHCRKVRPGP